MILPDKITLPMIVLVLVYDIAALRWEALNPILTGLTLAGLFAILHGVSKGNWMGFGDVKLILLIGLIFGFPVAPIIFIVSTWIASICGLTLILFRKATVKSALPFGTFLSAISVIFILFEHELSFLSKIF